MPVPKRRHSNSRSGKRYHSTRSKAGKLSCVINVVKCEKCGENIQPHCACTKCGHYGTIK